MSPLLVCRPSDLYVAVVSGLCVGLPLGGVVGVIVSKMSLIRLNRHSQGDSDGQTF